MDPGTWNDQYPLPEIDISNVFVLKLIANETSQALFGTYGHLGPLGCTSYHNTPFRKPRVG